MHLEAVVDAHAAAFLGRDPWDVAHDRDLLADAHRTAWACYRHQTVVVGIDLASVEAEAWGTAVKPPSDPNGLAFEITEPLLASLADTARLPYLDPAQNPRLLTVLEAARRLLAEVPATVAVPVAGPLALATALAGAGAIDDAVRADSGAAREALTTLVHRLRAWIHAIARCGAQIAVVEAPYDPRRMPPAWLTEAALPALRSLLQVIRVETRFAPSLFIDGDTAPIAHALAESGAGLVNCPAATGRSAFLEAVREFPDLEVRMDVAPGKWADGDWPGVCRAMAEASIHVRRRDRIVLGTGRLPLHASSVLIVDARNFAASMDPWLDPI
jgi:hypothetical protein